MAIVEPRDETRIGVSRPRPDSREKVTGLIRFEADRPHMGLLLGQHIPLLGRVAEQQANGHEHGAHPAVGDDWAIVAGQQIEEAI